MDLIGSRNASVFAHAAVGHKSVACFCACAVNQGQHCQLLLSNKRCLLLCAGQKSNDFQLRQRIANISDTLAGYLQVKWPHLACLAYNALALRGGFARCLLILRPASLPPTLPPRPTLQPRIIHLCRVCRSVYVYGVWCESF